MPTVLGLKAVPAPPSLDGDTEVPRGDLNLSRAVQLQTSVSMISEPKPVHCAGEADRDLPRGTAPCLLSTRHPGGAVCLEMHLKQSSTRKGPLLAHPCGDLTSDDPDPSSHAQGPTSSPRRTLRARLPQEGFWEEVTRGPG